MGEGRNQILPEIDRRMAEELVESGVGWVGVFLIFQFLP